MEGKGAYTYWQYFRKGEASGQVATLITLVIAVIFLFTAVTLNIGQLTQKKTMTANAADGAAMKLASFLGSYSNKLSLEYLDGTSGYCKKNYSGFWQIITTIVAVVLAVVFQQHWLLVLAIGVLGTANYVYSTWVMDDGVAAAMQRQLSKLKLEDNITEQAIMYALVHSVDDPTRVEDIHDYDEDGDTTDKITRFSKWYAERLLAITGGITSPNAKIAAFLPLMEDFANEAGDFYRDFTEDATRCILYDDPALPDNQCFPAGTDGEFVDLLGELEALGPEFDVSFWVPDADSEESADDVDELTTDLNMFYLWALGENGGLLNEDFAVIAAMYSDWITHLYVEEAPAPEAEEAWYDEASADIDMINDWLPELNSLFGPLDTMIFELEQEIAELTEDLEDINDEIDVKNQEISDKNDEIDQVKQDLEDARNEDPPDLVLIAQLEADLADLEDELAALEEDLALLEADRDTMQADLDTKTAELDHLNNLRVRLVDAIIKLEDFTDILADFNADILELYLEAQDSSYTYLREATYSWHDSAGWHHVHVDASTFKLPWIRTEKKKKWYGFEMCVYLEDHTGDITINVERYDQSTDRSFFARGAVPLWKFRYVKDVNAEDTGAFDPSDPDQALAYGVHTTAVARYTYNALPSIVSVR
ncbi:MAG: AAA family ATPase [Candidatus Omnitrophica bacterium]|nr:AAA family ATPase [Candidatus Omnitrophota bacterium]